MRSNREETTNSFQISKTIPNKRKYSKDHIIHQCCAFRNCVQGTCVDSSSTHLPHIYLDLFTRWLAVNNIKCKYEILCSASLNHKSQNHFHIMLTIPYVMAFISTRLLVSNRLWSQRAQTKDEKLSQNIDRASHVTFLHISTRDVSLCTW